MPKVHDAGIASSPPEKQQSGNLHLLSVFGEGLASSLSMPLTGAKQLLGNRSAADDYFKKQDSSKLPAADRAASSAGNLLGNAAIFIGTTFLAKRIPGMKVLAPVVAGGVLGLLEPLHKEDSNNARFAHAAMGAATVSLLEFGPKAMPKFGMKSAAAEEITKVALAGFGAGSLNAQGSAYLRDGKFASVQETLMGGLAWSATGAAFHSAGMGLSKFKVNGISSPAEGHVNVIGNRFSDECFATRDFLQKNFIPFKVYDPETNFFARRLINGATKDGAEGHTMLIFSDGKRVLCPKPQELAEQLGIPTKPSVPAYDTVVVGAGPAGMQASIYGSSEGLRTLMIDSVGPGGQAGTTSRVENFMGFENGVSGPQLMSKAFVQSKRLGTEFILNQVQGLRREEDGSLFVKLLDGSEVRSRSVVMATGVQFKEMTNVPGMSELKGKGVYYGSALTEAPLTRAGEKVVIVGGANSAGQAAVKFSELVGPKGEVTILTRSPLNKGMSEYLINQIAASPNIKVEVGAAVEKVSGESRLENVTIKNSVTGESATKPTDSMFVFIGSAPKTHWLSDQLGMDENGFLITGGAVKDSPKWKFERDPFANETTMPGVFSAGDVHAGSQQRVIVAAAEGASSIGQIHRWLSSPEAAEGYGFASPKAARMAPLATGDVSAIWSQNPGHVGGLLTSGALWSDQERIRAAMPFRMSTLASMSASSKLRDGAHPQTKYDAAANF